MRTAETVLAVIRRRGERKLPLDDVYRQLFNPALYLRRVREDLPESRCHDTRGHERNRGRDVPSRRSRTSSSAIALRAVSVDAGAPDYIEKKDSTKKRPLGIPTWSDKLLQEVIRMILEAYYEPQFSYHSHGFRPGRGCHTALDEIQRTWKGTVWFIEGDISGCFDHIDHAVLMAILAREDPRQPLPAADREPPQGGIPGGLALPRHPERHAARGIVSARSSPTSTSTGSTVCRTHTRPGVQPRRTAEAKSGLLPPWPASEYEPATAWRPQRSEGTPARRCRSCRHGTPRPDYRRLRYVRYADDFLLGFAGPRAEAEEIKRHLGEFLRRELSLELSEPKTLITHGSTEAARFLGYELTSTARKTACSRRATTANAAMAESPCSCPGTFETKMQGYCKDGKPIHRAERLNDSAFDIIVQYQQEYRGLAQYYALAPTDPRGSGNCGGRWRDR